MATEAKLPTGNLQLTRRVSLLLRRDYFYTEPTRPTGGNPLPLNLTGYLALSVILLTLLGSYYQAIGIDVPGLGTLTHVLLGLFFLSFGVHLVLWTTGVLWRVVRGHSQLTS